MRAAILGLAATTLVSSSLAAQELNPSPYPARDQALENVTDVEVRGPFRVLILAGSEKSAVKLFGPAELLADAEATVEDGKLIIRFKDGAGWSWNPGSGMYANIMLPQLDRVGLQGSGSIKVLGLDNDKFEARLAGAGTIEIERMKVQQATFGVVGSGAIEADGTADTVTYGVGGSGKVKAKMLRARTATLGLGGSGRIYADVSDSAEISVGGSGRVEVVGGAACQFEEAIADKVECR